MPGGGAGRGAGADERQLSAPFSFAMSLWWNTWRESTEGGCFTALVAIFDQSLDALGAPQGAATGGGDYAVRLFPHISAVVRIVSAYFFGRPRLHNYPPPPEPYRGPGVARVCSDLKVLRYTAVSECLTRV